MSPSPSPLVLVIDDDRVQRASIGFVLAREQFRVEEAIDGKSALVRLAVAPTPDLILLDVILPEIDGFEVCREIRRRPALADVPVLMITSLDGVSAIDHAFQAGATDLISKPIEWPIFRQRVRRLVQVRQARQELEAVQARESAILELVAEAVVIADAVGKVETLNPAAAALFRVESGAAVGLPLWHLFAEALPPTAEPGQRFARQARRADGSEFAAEVSVRDVPRWAGSSRLLTVRAAP